ncbi:21770_t:CDS:2, partial [Racocetra persica]
ELMMEHFTEEELEEIEGTTIPEVPDLRTKLTIFWTNLNEIRQMIKESMFGNDYNREKNHDTVCTHTVHMDLVRVFVKLTNRELTG